jgi:osmotically-inducible protein OsmY
MTRRTRKLGVVLWLLLATMVAGCAGDRMSRGTEEAVDDSLLANKVTLALYSDKEVSGRQIAVEASRGVVQLSGIVASSTEATRAVQIAQEVKGVKEVRNRLRVQ